MPIYEYQCKACGNIVEHWQRMSDPPLDTCESCGGSMQKLISQSSFHLKGSGWYVTDYAGNKKSGSSGKDGNSGSSDAKSKKADKNPSASPSE